MQKASGDDILARAIAEDRIPVTMDLGFGDTLALSGPSCPGVIMPRLGAPTSKEITEALTNLATSMTDEELRGNIIIVGNYSAPLPGD